jgi:four helix bundle protein
VRGFDTAPRRSARILWIVSIRENAMSVLSFQDLTVWQRAVDLAVDVYHLTKRFPAEERFGMTSQLRKAAVSISSNIAEGNGRATTKDYVNFLSTARGSLFETKSLLVVSGRLDFAGAADVDRLLRSSDEVGRMLSGLRSSLQERIPP